MWGFLGFHCRPCLGLPALTVGSCSRVLGSQGWLMGVSAHSAPKTHPVAPTFPPPLKSLGAPFRILQYGNSGSKVFTNPPQTPSPPDLENRSVNPAYILGITAVWRSRPASWPRIFPETSPQPTLKRPPLLSRSISAEQLHTHAVGLCLPRPPICLLSHPETRPATTSCRSSRPTSRSAAACGRSISTTTGSPFSDHMRLRAAAGRLRNCTSRLKGFGTIRS